MRTRQFRGSEAGTCNAKKSQKAINKRITPLVIRTISNRLRKRSEQGVSRFCEHAGRKMLHYKTFSCHRHVNTTLPRFLLKWRRSLTLRFPLTFSNIFTCAYLFADTRKLLIIAGVNSSLILEPCLSIQKVYFSTFPAEVFPFMALVRQSAAESTTTNVGRASAE
jgi:hypothetical protein